VLTIVVKLYLSIFCFLFLFLFSVFKKTSLSLSLYLFSLRRLLYTTIYYYIPILWYANNAVMTHWFHEKFLLELQLYDVVLCTSSAYAVGRRIQELSKWPRISWYGRVSEWQKTTRRIAEEKLIIHLYGIQQTGMEKEIKVLLFFNIQWFAFM